MNRQLVASLGSLAVLIAAAAMTPSFAAGQPAAAPRLADGHPDLSGVWDYGTITPMERPVALGTKAFFASEEEAAAWERNEKVRLDRDRTDAEAVPAGTLAPYNQFWFDRGNAVGTKRTSLVVDPPDGRLPAMTPEGKKRADRIAFERAETNFGRPRADTWEDRPLEERCLSGQTSGPPMTPGPYNNNVQIFQTPENVAIHNEMIHDARIVPLDGRPHGHTRQWMGDSRGRWEGDTLVIDTINFRQEPSSLRNASANMHIIEKFTRAGADTLVYEFTVDDPSVWTRPWTAVVPMRRIDEAIYEYACHEGNSAMASILAGARAAEKAAAEAAKKTSK